MRPHRRFPDPARDRRPTAYSDRVDLDAYVLAHQHEWARLHELASKRGKLTGAEGDELLDLYQRVATHLSEIRTPFAGTDPRGAPVLDAGDAHASGRRGPARSAWTT